jgi:hypothetical protein
LTILIAAGGETVLLLKSIVDSNKSIVDSNKSIVDSNKSIASKVDSNEKAIRKLVLSQDPTPTPASLANTLVANLGENDRNMSVGHAAVAVLTTSQAIELKAITSEQCCVQFMTPFLRDVFEGAVVVNSEEFAWLQTQGQAQKPDLFVSHKWTYTSRTLGDRVGDRGQSDPAFRFGAMYDTRLYDSVYLLDCKLTCTMEALGELIIHMQHQSHQLPAHSVVRGMLFGKSQFMLLKVQGQELIERITGMWTEPGSRECITNFFPDLPWCGVDEMCEQTGVEVDESSSDRSTAFLGAGSFGRVLRVRRVNQVTEKLALKVSYNNKELEIEHRLLREHAQSCGCHLLVQPRSDLLRTTHLCGYVMTPVGIKSLHRNSLTDKHLKLAVHALFGLHSHSPIVIHGDPRLANIILRPDGCVSWVDLSKSQWNLDGLTFSISADIDIMIASVLGQFNTDTPGYNDLHNCCTLCSRDITLAHYDALYVALVAARARM